MILDGNNNQNLSLGFAGRILYDIPCKVCTDHSSGKHYGIFACDGCAGFFKVKSSDQLRLSFPSKSYSFPRPPISRLTAHFNFPGTK